MRNCDRVAYLALGLLIGGAAVLADSWEWLRAPAVNTGFVAVPRLPSHALSVDFEVAR